MHSSHVLSSPVGFDAFRFCQTSSFPCSRIHFGSLLPEPSFPLPSAALGSFAAGPHHCASIGFFAFLSPPLLRNPSVTMHYTPLPCNPFLVLVNHSPHHWG